MATLDRVLDVVSTVLFPLLAVHDAACLRGTCAAVRTQVSQYRHWPRNWDRMESKGLTTLQWGMRMSDALQRRRYAAVHFKCLLWQL